MLLLLILLSCECSCMKLPLRVYGAEDADPEAYPYVVRVEIKFSITLPNNSVRVQHGHLCTSSALTPTWALTAGHCLIDLNFYVDDYTTGQLVVRYGSVYNFPWAKDTFSEVISIFPHPMHTYSYDYSSSKMKNDVGLLKTTPMSVTRYTKLSAVDFFTMYGHEAIVAGFGITTKTLSSGIILTESTLALKQPLQILKVAITKCQKDEYLMPALCLAPRCGTISTVCGGDNGGPLIHQSGVVGIVSLGYSSGYCLDEEEKQAVNDAGNVMPISPYIEWINSYVRS